MSTLNQIKAINLSELAGHISAVLQHSFSGQVYWVVGDITSHTFYPNKDHHYFELVEKDDKGLAIIAKMQAVAWRNGAVRIKNFEVLTGQKFKSGIKISVKVQVDYHAGYGLKLVVLDVDPSFTMGQIELHRQATLNRLLKDCAAHVQKVGEVYKTSNNSLLHQLIIQRIAVISSSSSAGYGDFMHTLMNNKFGYKFKVNSYYTTVQGEANAEAAAQKIKEICASTIPFDAVVIIRGGGADTDFLLFDQFVLCAAIAQLPVPVITGIGHLKNQTLADLVAHTSTNAPTKAAEYIVAHNHSFETRVLEVQNAIIIKSQQILGRRNQSIQKAHAAIAHRARAFLTIKQEGKQKITERLGTGTRKLLYRNDSLLSDVMNKTLHKPQLAIAGKTNELKHISQNLGVFSAKYISGHKNNIAHIETLCRMMSPVNILKKGFALVYQNNKMITAGNKVDEKESITIKMMGSELNATITQKITTNGDDFNL